MRTLIVLFNLGDVLDMRVKLVVALLALPKN